MAPEVSVVLYFFTTAGLLTTALASAALSVSSASLAAAGAPSSWMSGSLVAGPSSNLLVSEVTMVLISMLVLPCFMKFLLVVLGGTKPPPTFLWYSSLNLLIVQIYDDPESLLLQRTLFVHSSTSVPV